jgi:uncharacterized protein (TIGR02996 family)
MQQTFEQTILEHPEDDRAFGVYADWLIERGDPRGELIAVQLALEDESRPEPERQALREREAALLAAHMDRWFGPLAPMLRDPPIVPPAEGYAPLVPNVMFRLVRGFLHTLEIEHLYVPLARAIRDLPELRFLQDLTIGDVERFNHGWPEGVEVPPSDRDQGQFASVAPLLDADLSGLRSFQIGVQWDFDQYMYNEYGPDCHTYCEPLPKLIERMPRVEELKLFCKDYDIRDLFVSRVPSQLKELWIAHFGVYRGANREPAPYAYPLELLADNPTFRNLTHLRFHPHRDEYPSRDEQRLSFLPLPAVRAVLRSPHLQGITHLQLRLSDMGDDGVREIIASGALARLVELDLRHGRISDEGARLLAAHPDARRLASLDLSGNALTDEGVALIESLGDGAMAEEQMSEDELAEGTYLYRGDTE